MVMYRVGVRRKQSRFVADTVFDISTSWLSDKLVCLLRPTAAAFSRSWNQSAMCSFEKKYDSVHTSVGGSLTGSPGMQCSLSCLLLLKPHPQSLSLSFLLRVSTVASSVNLPALWTPALLLTSQLQRPLCSVYGEDLVVIAVRYLSNKDDRVYAHDWSSLSWATLCSCPSLGSVHLCCLKFRGCWAITSLPLRIASSRNTPDFPLRLTHPGSSHKWNHTGTASWHLLWFHMTQYF